MLRPLACCKPGLSSENGLEAGSAVRGEPFSAMESDSGRGDGSGKGSGLFVPLLGDRTGMLETLDRKLLNEGMLIFAREVWFLA